MDLNISQLERKYDRVEQNGNKVMVHLNPTSYGSALYKREGQWQMESEFLGKIANDVLMALGLVAGSTEAAGMKVRVLSNGDHSIITEFKVGT